MQNTDIDRFSFQLGMINCFVEMVSCEVKSLALSPPLLPSDYAKLAPYSEKVVAGFGIKYYLEKSLIITDLQSEDFTSGKWSIIYYKDEEVLKKYFSLKDTKKHMEDQGDYNPEARKKVSREFMKLLSYPENIIKEKIAGKGNTSPFIIID